MSEPLQTIRLDKWLWYARFFKTRSLSAKSVTSGHCRVNAERVSKSSVAVRPGDVLTFAQARRVRVIRILDCGARRGPAAEAQTLYEDLTPPETPASKAAKNPRYDGKGRPTKKDRRAKPPFPPDGLA